MRCRDCNARIFYFTCTCGSSVLFDELGGGWPEHDCEERAAKDGVARAKAILEQGRNAESGTSKPFGGLAKHIEARGVAEPLGAQVEPLAKKPAHPEARPAEHVIKLMEPTADGEPCFFIGFVRERAKDTARVKQIYGSVGDLGRAMLGLPPISQALQLTIVDAGGEPNESYTAIADRGLVEKAVAPGALVGVSLIGKIGVSHSFWLIAEIQSL